MNRPFDIVIVGAGITGLTVAALLAHSKNAERLRVKIVDAGKRPAFDLSEDVSLRVSAIASGSSDIFCVDRRLAGHPRSTGLSLS